MKKKKNLKKYLKIFLILINIINELSERKISDEFDIYWAYLFYELKYHPKFEFFIPKFRPEDILGLFIRKYINKKKESQGFLLKKYALTNNEQIEELNKLYEMEFDSLLSCLSKIFDTLLSTVLKEYKVKIIIILVGLMKK